MRFMQTNLVTAPTIEPVTLAEMESHLRLESNDLASDLTSTQSIAPGAHVVAPAYSLEGAGVDVLNSQTVVYFVSGTNGASGTVDVKLQESDDDVAYTDITDGAFTQVTEANDNTTYEKAYTGIKQYIRAVVTVATATCSFGVDIVTSSPLSVEDTYITNLIATARRTIERLSNWRLITQTWDLIMNGFPAASQIILPYPPLQSVTSITYYDTENSGSTFTSDDYYVSTGRTPGVVALGYSKTWPTDTLRPTDGVIIRYVAGFGDTAADVPAEYKQAIMMLGAELYEHREPTDYHRFEELPYGIQSLIGYDRRIPV